MTPEAFANLAFSDWLRKVDAEIVRSVGVSVDDLPDCCYRDWFDDGVSAKSAAKRAIRAAKEG